MLDLKLLTEDFIVNKLPGLMFGPEDASDAMVLRAIDAVEMTSDERQSTILRWLYDYSVLRSFPSANAKAVAKVIMGFADTRPPNSRLLTREEIMVEFNRLQSLLSPAAPISRTTNRPRNITSLTSKALWCCYPYDVPMYDTYALNTLYFLSRICVVHPVSSENPYERYIDVWFRMFDMVESDITPAATGGYPYKVRIFDRMLWYLGQPSFD